jgi:undecaprenyl-diphosphatase
VIFTFALAFLFWHRLWSGAVLMVAPWLSPGLAFIWASTGRWIWWAVSWSG